MFYAIFSETWNLGGPYCANFEYKLVLLIWKTIWMICMSMRINFDTRKLQKYVKILENQILRDMY